MSHIRHPRLRTMENLLSLYDMPCLTTFVTIASYVALLAGHIDLSYMVEYNAMV